MRLCIHRGAHEIGGSCVEIEHEGARLVIDCGQPLAAPPDGLSHQLPPVRGLAAPDASLLGVLLSHGHRDHWGLLPQASAAPPIFMGQATERILTAAARWSRDGWAPKAAGHLETGRTFALGPFIITPHLVDHSAFDAYAFVVEAGGRTLFYSGDLRAHGRKGALTRRLIAKPPMPASGVDVLLLEGSSLGRLAPGRRFATEAAIEARLKATMTATRGLVLVAASAQNVDRVVSIYKAAKAAGRTLLVDLYAAEVLEATGAARIPQSVWPGMGLFTPGRQRVAVKRRGDFAALKRHATNRVFPERLAREGGRHVLLFRESMLDELERIGALDGAIAVWSQWEGYLEPGGFADGLKARLAARSVPFEKIHTSGHADIPTLQRLAAALKARRLVPIHTAQAGSYPALFDNAVPLADGQWMEI